MLRSFRPAGLAALVALASTAAAQDPVYRYDAGPFVIDNVRIETVTNGTIERGRIVIRDGRIEAVGADAPAPADAQTVDGAGLTAYPGLIDGGTSIGLAEIGAVRVTIDTDEIGEVTPQMKALTAVNPSSTHFPVTRVAGVTAALTNPTGGLLPGTSALIHTVGYTPAQMDAGFQGVRLLYPRSGRRGRFDRRTDEAIQKANEKALKALNEAWDAAELYARIDSARTASGSREAMPYQPEAAALLPVLRGDAALLVEANGAADIRSALAWVAERGVPRVVLTGAAEGWRVADAIAEAGVPVVTGPVTGLPTRASDRYTRAYENAALMHRAGVTVALRTNESENVRNLPFQAGFAAAYGMPYGFGRAEALEAVTITPARIFGVDAELGSIEAGKRASLFLADGDPFETATQIRAVWVNGLRVPMDSRQIRLYEEYLDRAPGTTLPGGG